MQGTRRSAVLLGQLCLKGAPRRQLTAVGADAGKEYASSCVIPTTPTPFKLVGKTEVNHNTTLYDFGLADGESLALPTCACILAIAPGLGADGSDVVRPYTPVSGNDVLGKFQLLVKRYPAPVGHDASPGLMSGYLHGLTADGSAEVLFKHIAFNVKIAYPFTAFNTISMVCAGTGIAPMYQALQRVLSTPGDTTHVTLLYGSRTVSDILLREELEALAAQHADRFRLVLVVGERPDDSGPPGWREAGNESGWIDEEKVAKHCYPPAADTCVFVCGLPSMYDALCGPRDVAEITEGSTLHRLGYADASCFKF